MGSSGVILPDERKKITMQKLVEKEDIKQPKQRKTLDDNQKWLSCDDQNNS